MSIERERYEQMMQPVSLWQAFKRLFVFPPLPRQEAPANPPSGGTSASKAVYRQERLPACTIAPSLDALHPAFSEPVTGYMSQTGYELLHVRSGWWTKFCLDRAELNPRGGVVEVEIRLRRVIEP